MRLSDARQITCWWRRIYGINWSWSRDRHASSTPSAASGSKEQKAQSSGKLMKSRVCVRLASSCRNDRESVDAGPPAVVFSGRPDRAGHQLKLQELWWVQWKGVSTPTIKALSAGRTGAMGGSRLAKTVSRKGPAGCHGESNVFLRTRATDAQLGKVSAIHGVVFPSIATSRCG